MAYSCKSQKRSYGGARRRTTKRSVKHTTRKRTTKRRRTTKRKRSTKRRRRSAVPKVVKEIQVKIGNPYDW